MCFAVARIPGEQDHKMFQGQGVQVAIIYSSRSVTLTTLSPMKLARKI